MLLIAAEARTSFFPAAVGAGSITGQALPAGASGRPGPAAGAPRRGSASPLPRSLRVPFQHRRHDEENGKKKLSG